MDFQFPKLLQVGNFSIPPPFHRYQGGHGTSAASTASTGGLSGIWRPVKIFCLDEVVDQWCHLVLYTKWFYFYWIIILRIERDDIDVLKNIYIYTLEVNHHLKNGGSFWKMINLY